MDAVVGGIPSFKDGWLPVFNGCTMYSREFLFSDRGGTTPYGEAGPAVVGSRNCAEFLGGVESLNSDRDGIVLPPVVVGELGVTKAFSGCCWELLFGALLTCV